MITHERRLDLWRAVFVLAWHRGAAPSLPVHAGRWRLSAREATLALSDAARRRLTLLAGCPPVLLSRRPDARAILARELSEVAGPWWPWLATEILPEQPVAHVEALEAAVRLETEQWLAHVERARGGGYGR